MDRRPGSEADEWARWSAIPSSILSDAVGRFGAMASAICRRTGIGVAGPAFPVRTMPGDNRTIHLSLMKAPRGCVLVIDAAGFTDRAVWGEVLTRAAIAAGVVGVVIDGATRDVAGIRELDFPVFARGVSPAGPHKAGGGVIGDPISCGGVVVAAGDLVVGDEDGVVVASAGALEEVYRSVTERIEAERRWIARIADGESSAAVLGLIDAARGEGALK